MAQAFGLPPLNKSPLQYAGNKLDIVPTVEATRDPTTTDTKYAIETIWRNSSSLDQWILVGFTFGVPQWRKFTAGSGSSLTQFSVPLPSNPTVVVPTALGNITLTSTGATVAITGSANTINFDVKSEGFNWIDQGSSLNPAIVETGYRATATIGITLPNTPADGSTIKFQVTGAASTLTITAGASDKIEMASKVSAAGGTAVNTAQGDTVELVYQSSSNTWFAQSFVGNWNVT